MMDNHYIIASTIEKVDHELQIALDKNVVHENHEYVENKDSRYFIHSSPFYDINTNEVGSFHILIDISGEYEFLSELLINVTIVILVLLSFMIMYYFKFLQKIEKKLNDAYKEIELISITDVLTNLNNKRYYLENAPKQINTCSRCNAYISFILLDVDNFKQYNDNYGHLQGDVVLQEISLSIKDVFQRTSDCCYRVGGEEFLIVSESEDENNGYKMAEKLREAIIDLNIEHKYNISLTDLTVSIGVCTQKTDKTTKIEELYNSADIALYKSKENGRNQVTLFDNIT